MKYPPIEKITEIVIVENRCQSCGGALKYSGVVLTVDPPLYPHTCKQCGESVNLSAISPRRVYRETP